MKQNAGPIAIVVAVVLTVGLLFVLGRKFLGPTVQTSDHPQIPAYAQQYQKTGTPPPSSSVVNNPGGH